MAKLKQLIVSETLVLTVVLVVCSSLILADGEVVEWVLRRLGGDFYKYINNTHERCYRQANATFLVDDGQCVGNQDLFTGNTSVFFIVYHKPSIAIFHWCTGCTHAIVPSSQLVAIIATINYSSVSILHLVGNDPNLAERFHFNGTDQPVNSSFCHIASLEVFRGWEQAIQISHSGFSLSDNGTVEVIKCHINCMGINNNYKIHALVCRLRLPLWNTL